MVWVAAQVRRCWERCVGAVRGSGCVCHARFRVEDSRVYPFSVEVLKVCLITVEGFKVFGFVLVFPYSGLIFLGFFV